MAKSYKATTGVDEFYYGVLDPDNGEISIIETAPERVKFLQEITVNAPQEIIKGYGDNGVAEMATSNGPVEVSTQFHKVPIEDRIKILGLDKSESGLFAYGKTDNPPYVAVVFAKTFEDGSKEWVGLPKGKFIKPEVSGSGKQESVEFSSDSVTGEFMDRSVTGFDEDKSVIFAVSTAEDTAQRDALFTAVFGAAYPASAGAGE